MEKVWTDMGVVFLVKIEFQAFIHTLLDVKKPWFIVAAC